VSWRPQNINLRRRRWWQWRLGLPLPKLWAGRQRHSIVAAASRPFSRS